MSYNAVVPARARPQPNSSASRKEFAVMRHPSAPNNNGPAQRARNRGAIRTHLGRKRTGPRGRPLGDETLMRVRQLGEMQRSEQAHLLDRLTLGSIIEVFPGRRHAATLADVWRSTPVPGAAPARVRLARVGDFAAIRALHRESAPFAAPWTLKHFESRIHAFPEGQLVAVADSQVVG